MLNPDLWPVGTYIRRYYEGRRTGGLHATGRDCAPTNALDQLTLMAFSIVSCNGRGLRVGHSDGDKARHTVVDKLLEACDVLCIQETFLAKQDLDRLNGLHKDYHGAGESTTN